MEIDLGLPQQEDGYRLRPSAEPFPAAVAQRQSFLKSSSESPETEETDSAEARQVRKHRGPRLLPTDSVTELRNSDLAAWNANYLSNMAEASRHKEQQKLAVLAKQNAMMWVFGNSIGGIISRGPFTDVRSPLDMFSGERLMEALIGNQTAIAGRKRARKGDDGESSESEERRRRPRSDDNDQVGRGVAVSDESGDMLPPQFDDTVKISVHNVTVLR
jgi:meiotic recombination protein REC8